MHAEQDYVKFFLHRNQLQQFENINEITKNVLHDERISTIITELQDWPCYPIKSHKTAQHPLHKLAFIAELGFNKHDPQIENILNRILENQNEDGPFNILINIPPHFGGTGKDQLTWVLSDAPLLAYSAIKLNAGEVSPQIRRAVDYIAGLVRENGWPCAADKVLGKFKGPGRRTDPCPYANLLSLKMLALTEKNEYTHAKEAGIQTLLDLWERRKETKPFLFAMGTDFKKLKAPLIWYDIVNVVDTLSCFETTHRESRFLEMWQIIKEKELPEGGFIPESVWMKWKGWDFTQKKVPSEFLNALIFRIENRLKI